MKERKRNAVNKRRRKERDARFKEIQRRYHKHAVKRKNYWAKLLTNDGELITAFATMVSRGVPPSADNIPRQLKAKFPSLKSEVRWPNKDLINDLSCRLEQVAIRTDVENSDKNVKP